MVALVVVVMLAVAFDVTNGFDDPSNSIAAPVATRAMRPGTAVTVAAVFTILGPILAGTAVADTVGGLIRVGTANTLWILFAALLAALAWNLATWWWGLPSSSSHALVGGLVGAGVMVGGLGAVRWGGFDGWRPVGVPESWSHSPSPRFWEGSPGGWVSSWPNGRCGAPDEA